MVLTACIGRQAVNLLPALSSPRLCRFCTGWQQPRMRVHRDVFRSWRHGGGILRIQVPMSVLSVAVAAAASWSLVPQLGLAGAGLSMFLAAAAGAVSYFAAFLYILRRIGRAEEPGETCASAVAIATLVVGIDRGNLRMRTMLADTNHFSADAIEQPDGTIQDGFSPVLELRSAASPLSRAWFLNWTLYLMVFSFGFEGLATNGWFSLTKGIGILLAIATLMKAQTRWRSCRRRWRVGLPSASCCWRRLRLELR